MGASRRLLIKMKKDLILAVVPIIVEHLAGGIRDWFSDRRLSKQQWEQKIEDAKAGKYDTEAFS